MSGAFAWGLLAGSSLLVGGAIALRFRIPEKLLGLIMAFGAGVLISAVAYELVAEGYSKSGGSGHLALGTAAGALTFYAGDAVIAAVFLSNLPEAIAATTGLRADGWSGRKIMLLWVLVAIVSGLASLFGYAAFDSAGAGALAFVLGFAGGAILTMLADTMMPEAYEHGGKLVGLLTTLGFGLAFALTMLE